jgi:hypothetical protein
MSDASRRVAAWIGILAIAAAVLARLLTTTAGHEHAANQGQPSALAAPQTTRAQTLDVGEGSESKGGLRDRVPHTARVAARHAIAAYRALEAHPASPHALSRLAPLLAEPVLAALRAQPPRPTGRPPALAALVVASTGPGQWTATALTRRGEPYLVLELRRVGRRLVVTGLR